MVVMIINLSITMRALSGAACCLLGIQLGGGLDPDKA